jgi:hypothetical protein
MSAANAIAPRPLPAWSLLSRYAESGDYTDCYVTDIPGDFSHAEYVAAFYTTWLFRLERLLLTVVRKPSTDEQARQLAQGERDAFAAWTVEARAPNQLLLCDFLGNTRSWLMAEPVQGGGVTRLYFGSAVVANTDRKTGQRRMRGRFRALLAFHQRYSHALLAAAKSRLAIS